MRVAPVESRGRGARLRYCRSPLTARSDRRRPVGRARPGSRPGRTTGRRGRRGDHRALCCWRRSSPRGGHPGHGRTTLGGGHRPPSDLLARAGFSASGVSGVRMALEPGRGRTAVPVRSTLLAAIVGVAAVSATFTITESADHLLDTPRLYGHNWDAVIGVGIESSYPDAFVDPPARRSCRSRQLAAGTVDEIRIGGKADRRAGDGIDPRLALADGARRSSPGRGRARYFSARRRLARWRPRSETRSRGASATGRPRFASSAEAYCRISRSPVQARWPSATASR